MNASTLLLFLHIVGFALWFGVAMTLALLTGKAARTGNRDVMAFTYRSASQLLKGPGLVGMLLTIGSGFALSLTLGYGLFRPFPNHWLFQMQLLGTLAFLLATLYQIPLADRLARAAEATAAAGEDSHAFVLFRKRNAIVSSIIGFLLTIVIFLGAVRPG